ncbi:MAG: cytochrome c, partial [Thermoanaerobaculia bacterium]|nr:cytochrome c [Thermoanaerobaculia bacterium]
MSRWKSRSPRETAALPTAALVLLAFAGLVVTGVASGAAQSQAEQGEQLFKRTCFACHTVGGGRLVGPDLRGVGGRRSEEWLIAFVQNSQKVIQSGDPTAVALFEEYFRIPMPAQALSDDEVRAVLAFTRVGTVLGPAQQEVAEQFTPEQILLGQNLFQGKTRLASGGPSCNSCHEVTHDAIIGGGILARDLTAVFSRLGGSGVRAILGSPPFPVMQRAYRDRPLTEMEVAALVGFLQQADAEQASHQRRDYGIKLFTSGAAGAVVLLGLYSLAWRGRKS